MIFVLFSSVYAADVEEKQSFYGRLTSAVSSVYSYLPSMKTTIKASAVAGCTALYFMQNSSQNQDHSIAPSFNETSTQLVPFQGSSPGRSFNQIACLAITGLVGSFTGTLSSLLMSTSCLATGVSGEYGFRKQKEIKLGEWQEEWESDEDKAIRAKNRAAGFEKIANSGIDTLMAVFTFGQMSSCDQMIPPKKKCQIRTETAEWIDNSCSYDGSCNQLYKIEEFGVASIMAAGTLSQVWQAVKPWSSNEEMMNNYADAVKEKCPIHCRNEKNCRDVGGKWFTTGGAYPQSLGCGSPKTTKACL